VAKKFNFHFTAEHLPQFGHHVLRLVAGEQTPVQLDDDFAGDDVDLVAAAHDGGVDGVVKQRVKRPATLTQRV
jgi:hypothetical protein